MESLLTIDELREFEKEVAAAYEEGKIRGPVHLSGGNEKELIEIFKEVKEGDWVFSTHRAHYHALLKGIPREWLMTEVMEGRSMGLMNAQYRFFTSSIVGGVIPIALGVAMGIKMKGEGAHVWCFIGDMAALTGIFAECQRYAANFELPITLVIEDNGLSVNTPTEEAWGIRKYHYRREWPHIGCGKWVVFT